jgi:hypothetical protein
VAVQALKDGKALSSASGAMMNEEMNQLPRGNRFVATVPNIDICDA